ALGTGLCGGLSTMSTLAFEGFSALHAEDISGFAAYMAATFILGIMSACLGAYCGKKACDRIGSSEGKREG
ncbi:MAG: CrcB family protein, partial [Scardovia wiggsiae]|nr:CrcB family protein [Scardovia wiggsiae]